MLLFFSLLQLAALGAAAALVKFLTSVRGRFVAQPVDRWFRAVANHRALAIAVSAAASLFVNVLTAAVSREPVPMITDEFSYLLGGDTFAHGRCTNPTHPCWEHFESYHVIHRPTYQSKFPPGQALFLAAGQALTGKPIVGVWLSLALASGAICWALQGGMPPRWAFLGGLLAATQTNIVLFWGQSYWGGGVAMLGGALLYGAAWRLVRSSRVGNAIALGVGLALLANSRPYEGLVASLPVAGLMLALLWRRPCTLGAYLGRTILPVVAVVAGAAALMGVYNQRVTGSAWELPYQTWERTYQGEGSIAGTVFRGQRNWSTAPTRSLPRVSHELSAPQMALLSKVLTPWLFQFGLLLSIPWLSARWLLRAPPARFAAGSLGLVLLACVLESAPPFPHYSAPITVLAIGLAVQGLRHVRPWRRNRRTGRQATRLLVTAPMLATCLAIMAHAALARFSDAEEHRPWHLRRADIAHRLRVEGGRHLLLVRYAPTHSFQQEWVFNGADLDEAGILWARELTPEKNASLFSCYPDRRVWLVQPDQEDRRLLLTPYPRGDAP